MHIVKKPYEEPSVQLYRLSAQDALLNVPVISGNNGFGFDDDGPAGLRSREE